MNENKQLSEDHMLDDIKLGQINSNPYLTDKPAIANGTESKPVLEPVLEEGVTVTHQLQGLLAILQQDVSTTPHDNAKVMAMKALIQSGQYQIDINALSDKLLDNGLVMKHD